MFYLKNLDPILHEGEYVFASVHMETFSNLPKPYIISYFRESEGISIITDKNTADTYQIPYDYSYAWIKLNVYSDLASVGLTSTISNAFAKHNMSCNIIAAFSSRPCLHRL